MIRLNTPIESLVINLQSAGNVQYNIQYVIVRQGTRLEKSTEGLLTSSGQNVVLINDFSSGYFDITYINVTNIDPTENFISVLKKTNVSEFNLTSEAIGLKNRECTEFTSESGFKVLDQNGSFKTITESVSADGDVENSDMSYMASVPSGGTLTLPDSQINVNGVDEGDVISVKTIDVDLTDGVDPVVPTSVGLVGNTLTITLPSGSGGDVDIEINGNLYDTISAPDTVDIPVINSVPASVGTITGLNVVVADSTAVIKNSAGTTIKTEAIPAATSENITIINSTVNVRKSDATLISAVTVLAEGSANYNVADSTAVIKNSAGTTIKSEGILAATSENVTINDSTAVIKNSVGTTIKSEGILAEASENITINDSVAVLKDTAMVTLDTVNIFAEDTENIVLDDFNVEVEDPLGSVILTDSYLAYSMNTLNLTALSNTNVVIGTGITLTISATAPLSPSENDIWLQPI